MGGICGWISPPLVDILFLAPNIGRKPVDEIFRQYNVKPGIIDIVLLIGEMKMTKYNVRISFNGDFFYTEVNVLS